MLMKGMEYWENAYEKAPAIVISHKKPSACPRLETIFEEGSELNSVIPQTNTGHHQPGNEATTFCFHISHQNIYKNPKLFTIDSTSISIFQYRNLVLLENKVTKMAEDIRYMQELGEVAPSLVITYYKPNSSPPLEPIAEEESGGVEVLNKTVFVLLPVLLSLSVSVFLYR
ncbi:hypothetical protein V6N13_132590 [Hibiscus sabdariffa]|uniref:Uncharacterized protein n=1 Tax=Hibiscus sabdariffa TaxID=183260 RepID=A0ABR2PWC0_9ROSI